MHFFSIFLSLAAAVSAIDVEFVFDVCGGEGGGSLRCTNVNPDTCCRRTDSLFPFLSMSFRAIPADFSIVTRSFPDDDDICRQNMVDQKLSNGSPDICHGNDDGSVDFFTGSYSFINIPRGRKRKNTKCQMVDEMMLRDGQKYDLTGMSDDLMYEVVNWGMNVTGVAEMPTEWDKYKKSPEPEFQVLSPQLNATGYD